MVDIWQGQSLSKNLCSQVSRNLWKSLNSITSRYSLLKASRYLREVNH
ncbi:hypothetical protein FOPG_06866 [Fusarium oxysporum f. sp. conglutinans race 2 54008]|uniref:Uncharacterized protein n=1 Tax=Fusarium oxysporum f. sp. conglutinans race 2 54008 TaxID=1089457 RepID=X0J1K9_FUSOX|nr:hypothetical protein FOPG_06866 [Fusarium oxysporum f. sp. conglutinans race 2 54008]KAI8404015.1 hypothetical protein FOFC_15509 [Fusarium oxysporum]